MRWSDVVPRSKSGQRIGLKVEIELLYDEITGRSKCESSAHDVSLVLLKVHSASFLQVMKSELPFPHHSYQTDPMSDKFELVCADRAAAQDDLDLEEFRPIADQIRSANVAEIVLVHGTFAGNDVLGILREVARFSPWLADSMRSVGKDIFDQLAGDVGNYTQDFADRLHKLINAGQTQATSIPVTRFHWSGENHHLGRAGGAIELLDKLSSQDRGQDKRVLIWGHSHGGNLLAMMGHLISASESARTAFFEATRSHYRDPILRRLDLPIWETMRQRLSESEFRRALPVIDVVTFGTPLRYRWNTSAFPNLLHFVQHRPTDTSHPSAVGLPKSFQEIYEASGGDYVQQLGIGGTDFLHSIIALRSWNAELRLQSMFESSVRRRDLAKNLQQGKRVSLDGQTLLVDYAATPENWHQKLVGHGVYTRHEWLGFHLEEITKRFY